MSTDKKSIDWYNKNASGYTSHVRNKNESIFHSFYEKPAMRKLIPVVKGKKVLSVGCGSGEDTIYLKKLGAAESFGIDISKGLIKIAKNDYPDCDFSVMDMEKLNFPNNHFDFVYSSLAIHYIENWIETFKQVYKILKPGSFFLFSCGHPVSSAMENRTEGNLRLHELSYKKDKKQDTIEITGDYLSHKQEKGVDWNVTCWHKPFGEIVNEIVASGFVIKDVVEPKPLVGMKKISRANYEKLNKIPYFLIFKLQKPKS